MLPFHDQPLLYGLIALMLQAAYADGYEGNESKAAMTPYEEEQAKLASTVDDNAGMTEITGLKAAIEGASEA